MSTVKYTKKIDSPDAFRIDPVMGVDKITLSRKYSRREKVLIAAFLLALAAAVVFMTLYILQVSKSKEEVAPSTTAASACLEPADFVVIASG